MVDDDLFNVPDNDEEMLENEEDEEEEDEDNNENDGEMQVDEPEEEGDDDDGEDGEEEDGDDDEGEDDDEGDEEGEDEEEDDDGEEGNEEDNDEENDGQVNGVQSGIKRDTEDGESRPDNHKKESDTAPSAPKSEKNGSVGENGSTKEEQQKGITPTSTSTDQENEERLPVHEVRRQATERARATSDVEVVPTTSLPYTSQCHSIALTEGPRLILTGGEDGFIRKYDFVASIEGKVPLTVAQRHSMVDSVVNAGVISSYWENEQPVTRAELMQSNPKIKESDFTSGSVNYEPKLSPVYSLAAEKRGLWCLSGLLSGGISLYSMKYSEGSLVHYFCHGDSKKNTQENGGHNDAVSVLRLCPDEKSFLSGSWDKTVRRWDLNTGKTTAVFNGASGQISSLEYRPQGLGDLELGDGDNSDVDSLFGDSENEDEENKNQEYKDEKPKPKKPATSKVVRNDSVFMTSSIDGTVNIWDVRVSEMSQEPVIKYGVPEGVPPWCMSAVWANSGDSIYLGRRNSTVDEISLKMPHRRIPNSHGKNDMVPNLVRTLQFPKISGPVSAIATMPHDDLLLCGSIDNIRLYNLLLHDASMSQLATKKQATPFMIVPGHHGGMLSTLHVDSTGRFVVSASGTRGMGHSPFTETVLIYEVEFK